MDVYFIRHGQSMANLEKRAGGWGQFPLSPLGEQQAASLEPYLKHFHFDKIYASDLIRVKMTAQLALPGCNPEIRPELREINVGNICGTLRTELANQYGEVFTKAYAENDYRAFEGEDDAMMSERINPFFKELETLPEKGINSVAVFGSEGTIHHMVEYVTGTEFPVFRLSITNCSVSKFVFKDGKWKIAQFIWTPAIR